MKLIQDYNPIWKQQFQDIQEVLGNALHDKFITIEHIGSTSVPGLAAKAIIDIDIVYESEADFDEINSCLRDIGYVHVGDLDIPKREAFSRKEPNQKHPILDAIVHHLYACPFDSLELKRHLLFRDYLRLHADARKEYQELKRQIALETNQDRKAYAHLKEVRARAFVLSILELAENSRDDSD